MAAASPTAPEIFGVPASNLYGSSFQVARSVQQILQKYTELQDIMFGTPVPSVGAVNLGLLEKGWAPKEISGSRRAGGGIAGGNLASIGASPRRGRRRRQRS